LINAHTVHRAQHLGKWQVPYLHVSSLIADAQTSLYDTQEQTSLVLMLIDSFTGAI